MTHKILRALESIEDDFVVHSLVQYSKLVSEGRKEFMEALDVIFQHYMAPTDLLAWRNGTYETSD